MGDTFKLYDINQPSSYVSSAEADLLEEATEWLEDHSTPKMTYRAVVDPAIIQTLINSGMGATGINIGDSMEIIDADLGMTGRYRVMELTMDYETRRYDLTLSERRPLTNREKYNQRLDRVEKIVDATKANTEVGTQKSDETTAEVINRVFDRGDMKFRPDNVRTRKRRPAHAGLRCRGSRSSR